MLATAIKLKGAVILLVRNLLTQWHDICSFQKNIALNYYFYLLKIIFDHLTYSRYMNNDKTMINSTID